MTRKEFVLSLLTAPLSVFLPTQVKRCPPAPKWKEWEVVSARKMNAQFDYALKHGACNNNGCVADD